MPGSLTCAAVAMAATLALPMTGIAATPAASDGGGGAWVSLQRDGRAGVALLEWPDATAAGVRISVHLAGLPADDRLRVVLSSASCGQAVTPATRLWSGFMAVGAKGVAWRARTSIVLKTGDAGDVHSVRLMEEEGIFSFCRAATVWDDTDIVQAQNGAVGVLHDGPKRGIVVVGPADADGSLVTWSLSVGDTADLRVVGTPSACDAPVDPEQRVLSLPVERTGDDVSFRRGRTETVDRDETITIHALRLKVPGGPTLACERPAIIAVRAS